MKKGMQQIVPLSVLILILFSSCSGLNRLRFVTHTRALDTKLPALSTEIDVNSIAEIFTPDRTYPNTIKYDVPAFPELTSRLDLFNYKVPAESSGTRKATDRELQAMLSEVLNNPESRDGEYKGPDGFMIKYNPRDEFDQQVVEMLKDPGIVDDKITIVRFYNFIMPDLSPGFKVQSIPEQRFFGANISIYKNEDSFYLRQPDFLHNKMLLESEIPGEIKLLKAGEVSAPFRRQSLIPGKDLFFSESISTDYIIIDERRVFLDHRAGDMLDYMNSVIKDKICDQDSEPKGTITFEVIDARLKAGWYWVVTSSVTLFTINLFGFPATSRGMKLILKCTITDNNNAEIFTTSVKVRKNAYAALYWGYEFTGAGVSTGTVHRAGCLKAVSKAMNLIIEDIQANISEIQSALK
jgi:hypothetical protein